MTRAEIGEFVEASMYGRTEEVERFLSEGVDMHAKGPMGDTPVTVVLTQDQPDVLRLFLAHGLNVNHRWPNGSSMLYLAAMYGSPGVSAVLIEHGANVHAENRTGATPLDAAVQLPSSYSGRMAICRMLVAAGASPSHLPARHTEKSLTPFQWAIRCKNLDAVRFFVLEAGESLAQRTLAGKTLNYLAGKSEEMKVLLRALRTELAVAGAIETAPAISATVAVAPSAKPRGMVPI